jgi:hypothetical protein
MIIITVILFPVKVFYLVDWNLVLCLVGTDDNLEIKKIPVSRIFDIYRMRGFIPCPITLLYYRP